MRGHDLAVKDHSAGTVNHNTLLLTETASAQKVMTSRQATTLHHLVLRMRAKSTAIAIFPSHHSIMAALAAMYYMRVTHANVLMQTCSCEPALGTHLVLEVTVNFALMFLLERCIWAGLGIPVLSAIQLAAGGTCSIEFHHIS